jgi:peptidoglycan/xylan/chitin deacetylase (PgdA/CDA1 family)
LVKFAASFLFYSGVLGLAKGFVRRFRPRDGGATATPLSLARRRRTQNVQILLYHRVNDEQDPFFPAVPIHAFAQQMDYLASQFSACSLADAIAGLRTHDLPENTVVVTFDDGYRDNYLNAFPILKKFSIPATIFLATEVIDSGKVLWHDRVFAAFRNTRELFLTEYNDQLGTHSLRTVKEKLLAQARVRAFLRSLENDARSLWIARLVERLNVEDQHDADAPALMLTWDEVRIMHRGGISFGSHTVSHPILSKVSAVKAREEIYESKRMIEERLGATVEAFAYPNGTREDFTEEIKGIVKEAGYTCAVTTIFGVNEIGHDVFALHRGQPWEHHLPTFAAKLYWYKYASSFPSLRETQHGAGIP